MNASVPVENLKVKDSTRIMVSTINPRRVFDVRMVFEMTVRGGLEFCR